jgi:hypothetical protein
MLGVDGSTNVFVKKGDVEIQVENIFGSFSRGKVTEQKCYAKLWIILIDCSLFFCF